MYNETVLRLFQNARNAGALQDASVTGQAGIQGQGPYMLIHLNVTNGEISEARYETYGCPAAHACGSWVAQWVVGRTPDMIMKLAAGDLITLVGGLPLGKEHCADLAVNAVRDGLRKLTSDPSPNNESPEL